MKIMMAKVYDNILEETSTELVAVKGNKTYMGKLFFEPICENVVEELESVNLDDNASALTVVNTAFELVKKFNQLAKDDKTYGTMCHWAYMNGLVDEYIAH